MCDKFPRKFDVQTSYKPLNYVHRLVFVVNIKFTQATYHTTDELTEGLCCLNSLQVKLPCKKCVKEACFFKHKN